VVARFRDVGDEHRELQAMRMVAWAYDELGDQERHARLHEEILRRGRAIGDAEVQWWSLTSLALHLSRNGRHPEAVEHIRLAYLVQQDIGDDAMADTTMTRLATVLANARAAEVGALALGLAERLHEQKDFVYPAWMASLIEEAIGSCREQLGEEEFTLAWQRGRAATAQDVLEQAAAAVSAPPRTA
jgi:hypothetical protein